MSNSERISEIYDNKGSIKLALIEQSQIHMEQTLQRIEKKIDILDKKIERVEIKFYSNLKWLIGISMPTIVTIIGLGVEIYQYIK